MDIGKKLVREMREIFDRDTLKIVTSSYDTEDYEEEMRGAGVDYILKKPVLQSQVYSHDLRDLQRAGGREK